MSSDNATSVSNVRKPTTWHATVLISNVLTVTTMDMLLWTALIKYHLQAQSVCCRDNTTSRHVTDPHLGIIATLGVPTMIIGTDTGSVMIPILLTQP